MEELSKVWIISLVERPIWSTILPLRSSRVWNQLNISMSSYASFGKKLHLIWHAGHQHCHHSNFRNYGISLLSILTNTSKVGTHPISLDLGFILLVSSFLRLNEITINNACYSRISRDILDIFVWKIWKWAKLRDCQFLPRLSVFTQVLRITVRSKLW